MTNSINLSKLPPDLLRERHSDSGHASNVVNIAQLTRLAPAFSYLSQAIDFPDNVFISEVFLKSAENEFPEIPEKSEFLEIVRNLQLSDMTELQGHYSDLFELNKRLTLYMTYYKLADSREQGNVLAKLKMLYEMFGVSLDEAELTDYLPTMLEFLSIGNFQGENAERLADLSFAFSVMEDGTYQLLDKAKEFSDEPYIKLVHLVREVLKYCIIVEDEKVESSGEHYSKVEPLGEHYSKEAQI